MNALQLSKKLPVWVLLAGLGMLLAPQLARAVDKRIDKRTYTDAERVERLAKSDRDYATSKALYERDWLKTAEARLAAAQVGISLDYLQDKAERDDAAAFDKQVQETKLNAARLRNPQKHFRTCEEMLRWMDNFWKS